MELRWQLTDAAMYSSITLERSESSEGPWAEPAVESRMDRGDAVALDRTAAAGHTYWYRLMLMDASGPRVLGMISAGAGQPLTQFALTRVAPNPSDGATQVEFTVPSRANVRIAVMDVMGREIGRLVSGTYAPGRYQALWTGDASGQPARAGLYFIRMDAPGVHATKRRVLNR